MIFGVVFDEVNVVICVCGCVLMCVDVWKCVWVNVLDVIDLMVGMDVCELVSVVCCVDKGGVSGT